MNIEQLPSGSYRIRQMYEGKNYYVTVKYKPTQKEAVLLMAKKLEEVVSRVESGTFGSFAEKYIAFCEKEGKSPSTVRGYTSIVNNISESFMSLRLSMITEHDIQREVDNYSAVHSAKSTSNYYGFINVVMTKYRPDFHYTIKLPSKEKKMEYEPSTEDVRRILQECKGTKFEAVLHCCVLAIRIGEARAITPADIDKNNVLTIDKDLVRDKNNKWILKMTPKTADSYRRILIPKNLADLIRKQGYVFKDDPQAINRYLTKTQKKLGIPHFRLHMLRHYAVAYLHHEGFTDQQIMSYGGWSNSSDVMKRAYRYNLDPEKSQVEIANKMESLF